MTSNVNMPVESRDIVDQNTTTAIQENITLGSNQNTRGASQENIVLDSNQVQIIKELSLENSLLKVTLYYT